MCARVTGSEGSALCSGIPAGITVAPTGRHAALTPAEAAVAEAGEGATAPAPRAPRLSKGVGPDEARASAGLAVATFCEFPAISGEEKIATLIDSVGFCPASHGA